MLKLSHISCRVDNLYEASKKFKDMGFYIERGASNINKANNFFCLSRRKAFFGSLHN